MIKFLIELILIIIALILFIFVGTYFSDAIGHISTTRAYNKARKKAMDAAKDSIIKSLYDGGKEIKELTDFLNRHTNEEIIDMWNDCFDGKPPYELDADSLQRVRDQTKNEDK